MGSTSMYAGTVGPIWQSVSFPPDRDITDSEIYLIVAVLFFVDKNLRDGEPRVRRELNPAWDEKFGLPPGGRPTWVYQRYGSLLLRLRGFYGLQELGGGLLYFLNDCLHKLRSSWPPRPASKLDFRTVI